MSEPEPTELAFTAAGESWLARPAGEGAIGSGRVGSGSVGAVHFFRASEPTRPLREALLPRGRFAGLFETELAELWAGATPIEAGPDAARSDSEPASGGAARRAHSREPASRSNELLNGQAE